MRMMKDVLEQENQLEEKARGRDNYAKLVTKVSQRAKEEAE
jgi:hypothetical protein